MSMEEPEDDRWYSPLIVISLSIITPANADTPWLPSSSSFMDCPQTHIVDGKKEYLCKCDRYCGGQNGNGDWKAYSTYKKHSGDDCEEQIKQHSLRISELLAQNSAQSTSTSLPDLNDQQGNIFEDLDDTNMQNVVEKDINAENMKDFPDLNILHNVFQIDTMRENVGIQQEAQDHPCNSVPELAPHTDDLVTKNDNQIDLENITGRLENEIEEPPAETATPNFVPVIDDIKLSLEFIKALENASLNNPCEQLDTDMLNTIWNPPQEQLSIKSPDQRLSLDLFLAMGNASEDTYNHVRNAVKRRHPDDDILSFYQVKKLVTELTGISPLTHDMCINSCMGYTGPFALNTTCHYCSEECYCTNSNGKQVAKKQFNTIPLAPQIQALWRTTDSAKNLCYQENYTNQVLDELSKSSGHRNNKSIFRDFFDGKDYLDTVLDKHIKPGDMTLLLSIDGAQRYCNKVSECWIYIWVLLDNPPDI
ncbi:hypothetical protein BDQ17DRAFT_1436054 [Cyathus striatus]|nr:hypothetical protein BDQ17DRAFT_1436054 [Cyathus striatus]